MLGLLAAYRFAVQSGKETEAQKRKTEIRRLLQGLLLIQDVCEVDGCICRGVGSDGYSHYPGSSDDQISPWLLALDAYMESGIPSEREIAAVNLRGEIPPLFKGYLRIGAKVAGVPVLDREFGSIDYLIWFDFTELPDKYVKHFNV